MLRHILKRQYDPVNNNLFFPLAKGSESLLQRMALLQSMEVHRGCVNTVVWDALGNLLLSGSDDQQLVICDPWERMTKTRIHTAHRANIFSAKFMPHTSNRKIISCSGDGIVIYTDIDKQEETFDCKFTCHASTCYDIITLPDDANTFLTCGEDDTVRWFDLRTKQQCSARDCQEDVLLNMGRAVTAVSVNPVTTYHLAVATQDSTIRIYDRRTLGTRATDSYLEQADRALLMRLRPEKMEGKNHRVTSLRYSHTGQEVLASYSSDFLYLFDTQNYKEVSMKVSADDDDAETSSGPTLKRLRLRGDWSDTGPQALPESEMRNQAGDVGQARPTLHATLMQRMTDVLSRMLNDPTTRASVQNPTQDSQQQPHSDSVPQTNSNEQTSESDVQSDREPPVTMQASDSDVQSDRELPVTMQPSDSDVQSDRELPEGEAQINTELRPLAGDCDSQINRDNSRQRVDDILNESHSSSADPEAPATTDCESLEGLGSQPHTSKTDLPPSIKDSHDTESKDELLAKPDLFDQRETHTGIPVEDLSQCAPSISKSQINMSIDETETKLPRTQESESSMESESCCHIGGERKEPTGYESTIEEGTESVAGLHHTSDPNIEGLHNRISSLRQGFIEKHQVEPSVNLSYSGQGAASGLISLDVGDEVDRDYTVPEHTHQESHQNTPQEGTHTQPHPDHTMRQPKEHDGSSQSQPSPSAVLNTQSSVPFCKCPGTKPSVLTSSTSSPAICDMEVQPSTSRESRMSSGQDSGAGTHGTRASELNLGPALDFGDDDSDDESTSARTASARMASAIERAVQRARGERAPGVGTQSEATVPQATVRQCFKGHRNARTMIKEACFWGDSHVMSGSDCGRVFAWERKTGRLVMLWEADRHVVNCLQPHPTLPVLATSGIDYDVKLWAPTCEDSRFDQDMATEITQRNEALLEETRDTITVPATFMIRMLASLNQIRRGTSFAERWRNRRQARRQGENDEQGNNAE